MIIRLIDYEVLILSVVPNNGTILDCTEPIMINNLMEWF